MDKIRNISIVMSVRNGGAHLPKAITSILDQTFQNFEFIIVDNFSSDTTPEIIDRFAKIDPRIKVIRREQEGNYTEGRSAGIQIAKFVGLP